MILAVHSSAELYGSDRSLLAICSAAIEAGHSVVCLLPADGPLSERLRAVGVTVRIEPLAVLRRSDLKRPAGWLSFAVGAARALQLAREYRLANESGVVVISNTSAVISGKILARRLGARHMQMVREIYSTDLERRIFGAIVRRSDAVVCVSGAAKHQFANADQWPGAVRVVNSGAHLVQDRLLARSADSATINIACVGRISSWKGQAVLLRAASILERSGHSVHVKLVGGEYGGFTKVTDELIALAAELGISEIVEFVGEVDDATPYYQWADIVVAPSEKPEPFGKVVIEAMNHSRPIVASNHGGPSEVLADGSGGVLFTPGDPDALASAIMRVDPNGPDWSRVSAAAFAKSLNYSETASGRTIVSIASELVTDGSVHVAQ